MKTLLGGNAVEFKLSDAEGNDHELNNDGVHWLLLIFHRHLG